MDAFVGEPTPVRSSDSSATLSAVSIERHREREPRFVRRRSDGEFAGAVMSIDRTWCAVAVLLKISAQDARIRSPILRRTSRVAHADNIRHPRVPPVHKNRRWKRSQSPPQADKGFAYPHRPKRMSTEAERSASVHSHWLRERADGGFEGKIAADARADLGLSEHAFHPSRKLRPTSWQP